MIFEKYRIENKKVNHKSISNILLGIILASRYAIIFCKYANHAGDIEFVDLASFMCAQLSLTYFTTYCIQSFDFIYQYSEILCSSFNIYI